MATAVTGCFHGRGDDGSEFLFEWHNAWNRVTPNANGTTGWATVVECRPRPLAQGKVIRVHLCAHDPCRARHADSKYGVYGPPKHVQRIANFSIQPEPALSALKSVAPAAVADVADKKGVGDCLALAQGLHAEKPFGVGVHGQLLNLARDIRRSHSYVGLSFFVLFGLLKKCRPFVWEGGNIVDLVEVFAPWALEQCSGECAVQAICVCFEVLDGGECRMVRVSEDHPLGQTKHFLAAASIGHKLECGGDSLRHRLRQTSSKRKKRGLTSKCGQGRSAMAARTSHCVSLRET